MALDCDIAIVGAGPYGLSLATQLKSRGAEDFRIFGDPMASWRAMPVEVHLKSPVTGTNVYSPEPGHSFLEWCRAQGLGTAEPVPVTTFTEYGQWAQKRLVPEVEQTLVDSVSAAADGFVVALRSGETLRCARVVVATGLTGFERMPAQLAGLPRELVSHTGWHSSYTEYAGRRVAIMGAGASALESAIILRDAGAEVTLLVRADEVVIGTPAPPRTAVRRVTAPDSCMGPGRWRFAIQHLPGALRHLPEETRVRLVRTYLGPSGSWWLREQLSGGLDTRPGCAVTEATPRGSGLRLALSQDGWTSSLEVDHLLCGTGYWPDVDRVGVLDADLAARVARVDRGAALSRSYQTSVPGLYMVGPAAMLSFGPLYRFVCGAQFSTPRLASHLARSRRDVQPAAPASAH